MGHRDSGSLRRGQRVRPYGGNARTRADLERPRSARHVVARPGRPGVRRALPAPRRPGAAGVHRRLRPTRLAPTGGIGMRISETSDLWWKTAVVYCLDVETFLDLDGDGIGDLPGLVNRIDYLADLGVTCLWLMPFYPTPDRDDGYDITDFYGVDSRLGSHGDLVELIRTARDRGIRVIADLVVNHTSDRHPWFKAARSSQSSPYRDYYVWRSDRPPDTSKETVFPGQEEGIWEYDEKSGEYFLHRFYKYQPDLNVANPQVRDEIAKIIGFWLELGLSGFRVDAVPFLLETTGASERELSEFADPHEYLK